MNKSRVPENSSHMAIKTKTLTQKPVVAATKATEKPGKKENEKAERDSLVASVAEELQEKVAEFQDADSSAKKSFFDLVLAARERRDEHSLSKSESQDALRIAFAAQGEYKVEELTKGADSLKMHGSDVVNISTILTLTHPKEEFEKKLSKAIEEKSTGKRDWSIDSLKKTARQGSSPVASKSPGRKTNAEKKKDADKAPFDGIEEFKNALAGICEGGEKSGFTDEEIGEAVEEQMSEWLEREKEEEEEKD